MFARPNVSNYNDPGDIYETRMLDFKTEDIGYVIFTLVQRDCWKTDFCFSYGQFCDQMVKMFPDHLINRGWGGDESMLLLFTDSDSEIVRIRNGISKVLSVHFVQN